MNKERRAKIALLVIKLEELNEEIAAIKDEEQDYYDNLPASFQSGSKGEAAEASIDFLQEALETIESAGNSLAEIA